MLFGMLTLGISYIKHVEWSKQLCVTPRCTGVLDVMVSPNHSEPDVPNVVL